MGPNWVGFKSHAFRYAKRLDGETEIISRFKREIPGSIPGRATETKQADVARSELVASQVGIRDIVIYDNVPGGAGHIAGKNRWANQSCGPVCMSPTY